MAKPGIIYRLNWASFHETEDIQCYVDISDYDNLIPDGDEAEVRDLIPSGNPATLSVIDNSDDPFTPIRAKQLTIAFMSDSNYSLSTFSSGSDQRWGVHYYKGDTTRTVFKGWLVLDDIQEPLLAPSNEVILTATDNLGTLKDVPLSNDDEDILRGKYKLIDILAYCLKKTGLELEIRCAFNIKKEDDETDISTQNTTDEHFFSNIYTEAITFEEEVGALINCYDVISRILTEEAFITQSKGQWWIVRVDEIEHSTRGLYITSFDADGVFQENRGEIDFRKEIGKVKEIKFSQEASIVRATRPNKHVKLSYDYTSPSEIPYNIRFNHGGLFNTVSSTQKQYYLDGWTLIQNLSSPSAPACSAYIERIFDSNGYEIERYVVLTSPSSPAQLNLIISSGIPVHEKDRFGFSVDFATVSDMNGSGLTYTQRVATIRLVGDDGTYWMLDIDGTWSQSNSSWSTGTVDIEYQFIPNNVDTTDFVTISVSAKDIPTDGLLYFDLYALNQQASAIDDVAIKFNNLQFTYSPFINGSYRQFVGQYHKAFQTGNYKATRDRQIYLSDSPKKLFKGALFKLDSWATVWSGSVNFANGNSFDVSGFRGLSYYPGQILRISTTTSNNMTTRVTGAQYHTLLTATTVSIEGATVAELDGSTLIETPVFSLADSFYNAAKYPTGVSGNEVLLYPYGELQSFDVWNQYNTERRVINNTCQGLELDIEDADDLPSPADVIYKWNPVDTSLHLTNKYFMLLSFNQNHDNQEWTGVLRQVVDLTDEKDYSNHEFKYIES